jgi:hypothetical protein
MDEAVYLKIAIREMPVKKRTPLIFAVRFS